MKLRKVTENDQSNFQAFVASNPTVDEALPHVLPNGVRVTAFNLECPKCQESISCDQVWLRISRAEFGKNVVETWESKGFCMSCRVMTQSYKRYRSDGTFDFIDGHQWRRGYLKTGEVRTGGFLKALWKKLTG
jgi:hypothetical protein